MPAFAQSPGALETSCMLQSTNIAVKHGAGDTPAVMLCFSKVIQEVWNGDVREHHLVGKGRCKVEQRSIQMLGKCDNNLVVLWSLKHVFFRLWL